MFTHSFKDFMQNEMTKTLSTDGTDPNPTQTLKSAQKLSSNLFSNPQYSNDVAKVSSMQPGIQRRSAIANLSARAANQSNIPVGQQRANPMDTAKFITMQFDKLGTPGSSTAGQFSKFSKKHMRKGMKK